MLIIICCALLFFICDLLIDCTVPEEILAQPITIGVIVLSLVLSVILGIILHELGHLICGLISGYTFQSFTVFSFLFTYKDNKLKVKKLAIPGLGGQCLMNAPEVENPPFLLYNLGGILANIFFGVLSIALGWFIQNYYATIFLFIFGFTHLTFAVINGLPQKKHIITNDMENILLFKKNPREYKYITSALQIQNMMLEGLRAKDYPEKLVSRVDDIQTQNAVLGNAFYISKLIDIHDFENSIIELERTIESNKAVPVNQAELINLLEFCYIVTKRDVSQTEKYKDKTILSILKQMSTNPSVLLTNYTKALLIEKDAEKAKDYHEQFNSLEKKYPFPGDYQSTKELFEIVEKMA